MQPRPANTVASPSWSETRNLSISLALLDLSEWRLQIRCSDSSYGLNSFPVVNLPLEIQLLVLHHCIPPSALIRVCIATDPDLIDSTWPFQQNWRLLSILPFPILQTCRLYRNEGVNLLYKHNTFLFTKPAILSADYSRDWYYTLATWTPKTTATAVTSMRHVRFESDRTVGEELVHIALRVFCSLQTLEIDMVGLWSREKHWLPQEAEELIDVTWNNMSPSIVNPDWKMIRFAGMHYDRSDWEQVILHVERLTGALGYVESHRYREGEQ